MQEEAAIQIHNKLQAAFPKASFTREPECNISDPTLYIDGTNYYICIAYGRCYLKLDQLAQTSGKRVVRHVLQNVSVDCLINFLRPLLRRPALN